MSWAAHMTAEAPRQGMLDTNIMILRRWIDPAELPDEMAISAITLAELSAGPHQVRRNDEQDLYDEHAERARRQQDQQRAELYHYRTKDKVEVDLLLEDRRGRVVAIEVKAASTVRGDDFRGLRHFADRLGEDLIIGIVLYTSQQTLPFGPRFRAMPISARWQLAAAS